MPRNGLLYHCFLLREKHPKVFCKKGVLRDFAKFKGKHTCPRISFLIKLQAPACNFIKKETLAQVFSREFRKISKNTFSYITPPEAASVWCFRGYRKRAMVTNKLTLLLNLASSWFVMFTMTEMESKFDLSLKRENVFVKLCLLY